MASKALTVVVKKKKTKTYSGCWTCRERGLKCDESRPSCLPCIKSGLNCAGYSARLCWDHNHTDNLRRLIIYNHEKYAYMMKNDVEINSLLEGIDALDENEFDSSMNLERFLPFGVFPIKNSNTQADFSEKLPSETILLEFWEKKVLPLYMPFGEDSKIFGKIVQYYLSCTHNNDVSEKILKNSLCSSSLLVMSLNSNNNKSEKLQSYYHSLAIGFRNKSFNAIVEILEKNITPEDQYIIMVAELNFLLTESIARFGDNAVNWFDHLKYSAEILQKIKFETSTIDSDYKNVYFMSQYIKFLCATSFTVNYFMDINPSILIIDENDLIFDKKNGFILDNYGINRCAYYCFSKLVSIAKKNYNYDRAKKLKNNNISLFANWKSMEYYLESQLEVFQIEATLWHEKERFIVKDKGDLVYERSFIFYSGLYVYFLREFYSTNHYENSTQSVIDECLVHLEAFLKIIQEKSKSSLKEKKNFEDNNNFFAIGLIWALLMIASESRKPKSQESCLKIFKTLKESNKVKVTSINCCIDIVKEYWRKRDQGLNNSKLLINTIINELQVYDILLY